MLKYENIIQNLTIKQKIALLTDIGCLADPEFVSLGIPYTSVRTLQDILADTGENVSTNMLARTWDPAVIKGFSHDMATVAKRQGTNFIIAPTPKIKLSPYASALSEDPYLSGVLSGSYLSGIHQAGIPSCISGFSLDSEDIDYMDKEPNQRILQEYFIYPFRLAANAGDCHSVMGSVVGPDGAYGDLNLKLVLSAESGMFHVNMNVLCDEHTPEATAEVWHAGGIVMQGVSTVLEMAYDKYNHIIQAIQEGHATVNDLEEAYADGSAISDDMIDSAVERVIDFAFSCQSERLPEDQHFENTEVVQTNSESMDQGEDSEQHEMDDQADPDQESEAIPPQADADCDKAEDAGLENFKEEQKRSAESTFKAIRESIVLLKNETKILPIKPGYSVAVIGDLAMAQENADYVDQLSSNLRNPFIGAARGYALNEDKSEELLAEALELARSADVVLLFLGIDRKRLDKISYTKHFELPANQAVLLEAMRNYMHKTAVILDGEVLPDASFDLSIKTLLLAPVGGLNCAHALAGVLCGAHNPSGRLTESYYDGIVERMDMLKSYKDGERNKVGPFMGYRHYDSSGENVRYPFGHGIGYTTFAYSHLKIVGNRVEFFIKNTGKVEGTEVVQVYVGKSDSTYIRPYKELKAFARVNLGPLEMKKVCIELKEPYIYDENQQRFAVEGGTYEVYVGASVSDIRLTGRMAISGEKIEAPEAQNAKRSDYLQSDSNILSDKYTLEAEYKKMKKSWKWKISYITCIVVAILLNSAVLSLASEFGEIFDVFGKIIYDALTFIDICLALFIAFYIIMDIRTVRRIKKAKAEEDRARSEQNFDNAISVESISADELFVKEFDEVIANAKMVKARKGFDLSDFSQFVDHDMTFASAGRELLQFAKERGVDLSDEACASLLSSFATSRFLMMNSMDDAKLQKLTRMLSEFFGCPFVSEQINQSFMDGSLLYTVDEQGQSKESSVPQMINDANEHKETIHFVTLTDVKAEDFANLFSQYIRYFNNPERECKIAIKGMDDKIVLPENIWIIVSLADGNRVQNLPIYMTELMSVVNVDYLDCEEQEEKHEFRSLGYYQINYLAERCKNGFVMSEQLWKKVDSLEEYVHKHSSYRFGNKLWLRLEKYISVLCSCEYELQPALDNAIDAILLAVIQTVLEGKLEDDDRGLLEAIELYFGEENVPCCRKTLKGVVVTEE